jgi:DMSO/TMAO reductase YedYZ molybdopterin-dependent catalytic subunit
MLNGILRRKEEEKRFQQAGRLPPGQALTARFPVLHYGPTARYNNLDNWSLRVWGEVEQPFSLTWEEFSKLPRTQLQMDLHCVTAWSKLDTAWEGVTLRTLIEQGLLKLRPQAAFLIQHAEYGFTANLPLSVALQENFLLATHFDGQPLSPDHGYPLRGVIGAIPGRADLKTPYLWKGAKWLRGLEFMGRDRLGFWEKAGYSNSADVWKEERYA